MKKIKLWLTILILIIIGIGIGIIIKVEIKNPIKIESIKSLHFKYSNGNSVNSSTSYDIRLKKDKYYVSIKPYLIPDHETFEGEINKKYINEIIKVLNKYEVNKWDGFNKVAEKILDGESFSFSLSTEDGLNINASGYMKWPKNYSKVKTELDKIIGELYPYKQNNIE